MLKPLKIPRGVANIFMLGDTDEIIINESLSYRPDRVMDQFGMKSMVKEIVNNYISNISPISCENGKEYLIADSLFNGYFVR